MKKFIIGYGLSGGYGGIHDYKVIEAETLEQADQWAFEEACDYYESYIDGHNIRDVGDIRDEEDVDEETAWEIFQEERERWLDYITLDYSELQSLLDKGYNVDQ